MLKKLKIGNIELKNNLVMAPMAGITFKPYRDMIRNMGASLAYTELISAYGLVYKNEKTINLVDIIGENPPTSVQIFGDSPDILADAAQIVESLGADTIDINMGCPVSKVVKSSSGAGLLKDEHLIKKILNKVVKKVKCPVTIKIRSGWDDKNLNYLNVGRIAEDSGVSAIYFHARTREQAFGKICNWSYIKELKENIKIPVIGNGNIFSILDAVKMFKDTNCDGVMIARGALSNPFIFKQIIDYYENGKYEEISPKEKLEHMIKFSKNFVSYLPEKRGIFEIRKFVGWITKGMSNAKEIRKASFETETLEALLNVLKKFKDNL